MIDLEALEEIRSRKVPRGCEAWQLCPVEAPGPGGEDGPADRTRVRRQRSVYRGVAWYAADRWRATVWVRSRRLSAGYHPTEEAAARAHDRLARERLGERAKLNFPDEEPARA